jgi:peptidoglycan/xylan/chitin deacetylase (PgdA/CDA1 family)
MSALERFGDSQEGLLRILCYHRIAERDEPGDLYPGTVSATPAEFDRQLDAVARRYRVVSLQDVLASVREARPLPRRAVLITFDDAYDDFASTAWPALKRYGLIASLFVPTAYPGRSTHELWWDQIYRAMLVSDRRQVRVGALGPQSLAGREQRLATFRLARDLVKRLPHERAMGLVQEMLKELDVVPAPNRLLDWSALRRLAGEGVEIGSHTRSHALLNRLDRAAVAEEIAGAFADLQRELGGAIPVLAYPAGGCGADLAEIAKEQGVEIGLTTRRGVNRAGRDSPLLLRRVLVGPLTTPSLLRAELLPWSGAVSRWRRSAAQATTYGP